MMEQVFPTPVDTVDPLALFAGDDRPTPPDRPWVMTNMIASVDGAVAIDGLSGGLGGPGDKAVFSAIRGVADIIVAAVGTVVAENYRRPQTPPVVQEAREARGQSRFPRLAIVTNSLSIDSNHRVFDPDAPPLVITHEKAPPNRRSGLANVAEIVDAGTDRVDLRHMLTAFADRGASVVLVEGGPTLNAAFVAEDLVDEFCLSVSPMLVGGNGPRVVGASDTSSAHSMMLDRTLHDEGFLFHRYLRNRP